MQDKPFYIEENRCWTYDQLKTAVAYQVSLESHYYAKDMVDYIIHLVACIVREVDVVLIDFLQQKTEHVDKNIITRLSAVPLESWSNIVNRIQSSKAKIGIFSSGTEGQPKEVHQSVSRLLKSVSFDEKYSAITWGLTYHPAHSAGLQMMLQSLLNHGTLLNLYKAKRSDVISKVKKHSIDYLSGTPTFYRMLAPYDFECPSVKGVTVNGEKSTPKLLQNIKSVFPNAEIKNIYGSTETGPLLTSSSTVFTVPSRWSDKIKITDDELIVHSSLVSKNVVKGEWYATGDLVSTVSKDPLTFEFVSRKSRIINVGGHNVNPQEVEEVLLLHPQVKDARVTGKPHPIIGNVVIAEVKPIDGFDESEIIAWCKEKLPRYKRPSIIREVQEIAQGKTGKKEI